MKKILIIYTQAGGGHLSLALALQESLEQELKIKNLKLKIELVDPFPNLYAVGYRELGSHLTKFYGANWKLTNNKRASAAVHTLNFLVVGPKLIQILKKEKPDLIISTFSFATVEIKKALDEIGSRIRSAPAGQDPGSRTKIVVALADPFLFHASWFTFKAADLYLSPTPEATVQAIKSGIDPSKIVTTGWLVREEFKVESSKLKVRKELGLDENKFTVLLGGSGQGGGRILKLAKLLISQLFPTWRRDPDRSVGTIVNCQLLIVAGMNRRLYNQLNKLTDKNSSLHILGYVENMAELISASDIVVGKAGPNLLFEAIFCERPFLATGCLPGQEEGNLEFIKKENLGWVEENLSQAVNLLSYLSDSKNLKAALAEKLPNLKRIKTQNFDASQRAAQAILKLLTG